MVATEFLDYLSKMQVATYVGVEDFADKFNFLYTVIILLLSSTVVTVKQYMMKPISCYMANDPGGKNIMDYVENYCWVQGTIPNDMGVALPETPEDWKSFEEKKILYYQWVPFVLGMQCILFYLPRVIWQLFCYNRTGTDLQHIVSSANQAVHSDNDTREKTVRHLAKTLEQMLFQTREYRNNTKERIRNSVYRCCSFLVVSKRLGTLLMVSYLFIKILFLLNAIAQVFLMQRFLGFMNSEYSLFGLEVLHNIVRGRDWRVTQIFPRVAFCYIPVKIMGHTNGAVAQCVLPVNMLNEKIYVFLWFWIIVAAFITALSIPVWIIRLLKEKSRKGFVKKYLKINEKITKSEKVIVQKFTRQFLRHDGIFLLRMISLNAGDIITADIVCQLWDIYKKKYRNKSFLYGADDDETNALTVTCDRSGVAGFHKQPVPTAPPSAPPPNTKDNFEVSLDKMAFP